MGPARGERSRGASIPGRGVSSDFVPFDSAAGGAHLRGASIPGRGVSNASLRSSTNMARAMIPQRSFEIKWLLCRTAREKTKTEPVLVVTDSA
jgi:hypothetical protein